jgi:LAS seventeen-binding protein 1/2
LILSQLPQESSPTDVSRTMSNLSLDNKTNGGPISEKKGYSFGQTTPSVPPPPAYSSSAAETPTPAPPAPPPLAHAVALYPYTASDAGDLALQPNDRVAITEYMNAEWWKGRSERTGQEGIFPRSYVRVEEKSPAPSGYGNMPMDVAGGAQQQQPGEDGKGKGMAGKIGGKLGNAALFGAGGMCLASDIFVACLLRHWERMVRLTLT